ncbi:MAG: hypothetical protein KAR42_16775 [candidate division Zixibacteria bacterium]|nr:hypothetical protein [candidate division Zixibacteria bacterium]
MAKKLKSLKAAKLKNIILSSNPCPICVDAARQPPMTKSNWKISPFGLTDSKKRYCNLKANSCHCILVPPELIEELPELGKKIKLRGDPDSDIRKIVDIGPNEERLKNLMDQYNATIGKLPDEIYDMPLDEVTPYLEKLLKEKGFTPGRVILKEPGYVREAKSNIIGKYKTDGKEHAMAFDKNGKLLISKSGDADKIHYSSQELYRNWEAQIHIHNHPSFGGVSFSDADLEFYSAMRIKKAVVVCDRYTYELSPIGKKWPSERALYNSWNQQLKNTKLKNQYGGDPGLWQNYTHEIMLRVAKKHNLKYVRIKTGGF